MAKKHIHTDSWKKQLSERMKENKYALGNKHSEDWKRQAAKRARGNKHARNHIPWNKGLTINDPRIFKSIQFLRKLNLGRPHPKGRDNPCWKGGRFIDEYGYIHIQSPNHPYKSSTNRVREHRLVMESWLREHNPVNPLLIKIKGVLYLRREAVVHHKNGIRGDNRIENLLLFKDMGVHTSLHNLIDNPNSKKNKEARKNRANKKN